MSDIRELIFVLIYLVLLFLYLPYLDKIVDFIYSFIKKLIKYFRK